MKNYNKKELVESLVKLEQQLAANNKQLTACLEKLNSLEKNQAYFEKFVFFCCVIFMLILIYFYYQQTIIAHDVSILDGNMRSDFKDLSEESFRRYFELEQHMKEASKINEINSTYYKSWTHWWYETFLKESTAPDPDVAASLKESSEIAQKKE